MHDGTRSPQGRASQNSHCNTRRTDKEHNLPVKGLVRLRGHKRPEIDVCCANIQRK
ncbi:hypothetical protein ATR1_056c0076 [Acetobacter tropicalis]|nr:hypothetical protein ATR1_056c0076 [Acetobacter tropicalis]